LEEEWKWTVDGFARIDRAIAGHPGLPSLEAAYKRLRERNPRLTEQRAREHGTLEWKFDPMLATMSVTDPFDLAFAMTFWRKVSVPTLIVHGAESGEFWRHQAGARDLDTSDGFTRASPRRSRMPSSGRRSAGDGPSRHWSATSSKARSTWSSTSSRTASRSHGGRAARVAGNH